MTEYITSALSLYDGGWRSDDRNELIIEYDLTVEEATIISKILFEIEKD